jgi:predicted unusual protein kinase regulating ubiquinone biosynthesis (AarF/ABC1/UbiB family)
VPNLDPRHLGRYARIGGLLVKHRASLRIGSEDDVAGSSGDELAADAQALAEDLEERGPTFVKLGQLLSTRADLLPPAYLEALSRLQDDVSAFGFADVERIVEEELGMRITDAFQSFDHEPMACASLGQVHPAVMRSGRPVAVKVQRPGAREQVADDIGAIEELAAFVDAHTRTGDTLRFAAMVAEFRRTITAELDYLQEAENLRTLRDLLAEHERIVVPAPIDDYTTSKVLTMELVEGRNIGSLGPLGQLELDGGPLATALFDAYLDQILVHGFVHADPHPGNVLLTTDGDLALIDVGMVTRLNPDLQDQLVRLLAAISDGQGSDAADLLAEIGERTEAFDQDGYRSEVGRLVLEHQTATVGQLSAGTVVAELTRAAATHGLRPPPEMTMVGKALLNLDEAARILDPDIDVSATIRERTGEIVRRKLLEDISPGNVLRAAMDAREFAQRLPGRVNRVFDSLADGELTLRVKAVDEKELLRGIQTLANRLTTGIVIAALIIGAAMVMRIETDAELLGYPAIAIVLFVLASLAGLWLVVTSLLRDLPPRRRRARR